MVPTLSFLHTEWLVWQGFLPSRFSPPNSSGSYCLSVTFAEVGTHQSFSVRRVLAVRNSRCKDISRVILDGKNKGRIIFHKLKPKSQDTPVFKTEAQVARAHLLGPSFPRIRNSTGQTCHKNTQVSL